MTAYCPRSLYHLVEMPSSRIPWLPAPPLGLGTPLVMPDLATLERLRDVLRTDRPKSTLRGATHGHRSEQPYDGPALDGRHSSCGRSVEV